jgi:hypothetical protein
MPSSRHRHKGKQHQPGRRAQPGGNRASLVVAVAALIVALALFVYLSNRGG